MAKQPGPGAIETLWGVLAGQSPGTTRHRWDQATAQNMREREIMELARKNITDPRELLNFLANRKAYTESSAKNYEPQGLAPGASAQYQGPAGPMVTAPVMGVSGDQGYTQTPDSFNVTGQRAPSFAENTQAEQVRAQIQQAIENLKQKDRHDRQTEGIGWYNARNNGGGRAAGVGSGTAPPDGFIEDPQ